jgi:hypothetical protein
MLLLAVPAFSQRGAITAPVSLDQMTRRADRIVHGLVVSAGVESHPQLTNLSTIVITMQVQDTLKGKAATTLTFRQFIWDLRDEQDAARYLKGQELLLFLNPVSQYGLTSPVGLGREAFALLAIERAKPTRQTVVTMPDSLPGPNSAHELNI